MTAFMLGGESWNGIIIYGGEADLAVNLFYVAGACRE